MQKFLFNAQKTKNNSLLNYMLQKMFLGDILVQENSVTLLNVKLILFFDYDTAPYSNMVLGEVINDRGNWSGYLPHYHPQPEVTISNLIDQKVLVLVLSEMMYFKSIDGSFAAIADSKTHPQAVAPGFFNVYLLDDSSF
mgnify:CR=1 FL=1